MARRTRRVPEPAVRSFIKEIPVTGKEVRLAYILRLSLDDSTKEQLEVLSMREDGGQ